MMALSDLPIAQIRASIGFPISERDTFEVVVDGEAIAQLHPTSVSYEMDWAKRVPQVVVRFIGGDADFQTRRPS
jgi:hypothetical protein